MEVGIQLDEQIDVTEEFMAKPRKKLKVLTCKRCRHQWAPRMQLPIVCPSCHSPYWNRSVKRSK